MSSPGCKCVQARETREQIVAAAKATDKAVHEHPYQALGIAFGVGLLARSRKSAHL